MEVVGQLPHTIPLVAVAFPSFKGGRPSKFVWLGAINTFSRVVDVVSKTQLFPANFFSVHNWYTKVQN